jgi:hypothetical protein
MCPSFSKASSLLSALLSLIVDPPLAAACRPKRAHSRHFGDFPPNLNGRHRQTARPASLRHMSYWPPGGRSLTCGTFCCSCWFVQSSKEGKPMSSGIGRRSFAIKSLALASLATLGISAAQAQETIKVGVLHSLSGTMAISETVLKDTVLMAIDEINAKGGVLARSSSRWSSTRPPTGRCSPRRRAS